MWTLIQVILFFILSLDPVESAALMEAIELS